MKVKRIYKTYQIPKNLQEHMLRVASLAGLIVENWKGQHIDKIGIVKACVLHDIAKPMNFDLAKQAQFGMSPGEIEKLGRLQNRMKEKYGNDEHQAVVEICKDLGADENTVRFVDELEWKYAHRLLEAEDIEALIPIYCDMRIGPKGILDLQTRFEELKNRTDASEYEENVKNGNVLEQEIAKNVKLSLNLITDRQINERFDSLLEMEIG